MKRKWNSNGKVCKWCERLHLFVCLPLKTVWLEVMHHCQLNKELWLMDFNEFWPWEWPRERLDPAQMLSSQVGVINLTHVRCALLLPTLLMCVCSDMESINIRTLAELCQCNCFLLSFFFFLVCFHWFVFANCMATSVINVDTIEL